MSETPQPPSASQAAPAEGEPKKKTSPWIIVGSIVAIVVIAGLAWAACGRRATPEPPVLSDPVCERVDSTGKIIVGTAGDYPPFEFYKEGRQLDGFDIALMKQIGLVLGTEVEFRDYAFEGLLGEVQLGGIDAAIAAITVTDERSAQVSFSDPYYFGRGAAVVQADSGITALATAGDFAGKRVGVERGTVYESWAEDNLVAGGVIASTDLFAYEKADHAIRDLLEGRLDIALMDDQVAKAEATDDRLAVAGESPIGQTYAIAVQLGAECWQGRINEALAALESNGNVEDLVQNYIGVPRNPIPTRTPGAPVPTATPVVCTDSSQYVMDLSYDDKNGTAPPNVKPDERFTKGWRIRNTGTCTWTDKYRLDYVGGNNKAALMDGKPVYVVGEVAPGQTYDFYVDLHAPSGVFGELIGRWQTFNPVNQAFGQTVFVMVNVVAPTAQPTQPPQPTQPQPTATPIPPTPSPEFPLIGETVSVVAIEEQPIIPNTEILLTFEDTGEIEGFGGCNDFTATYEVEPAGANQGGIEFELGTTTSMACAPEILAQEQLFFQLLEDKVTAYSYDLKEKILTLLDKNGKDIFEAELEE